MTQQLSTLTDMLADTQAELDAERAKRPGHGQQEPKQASATRPSIAADDSDADDDEDSDEWESAGARPPVGSQASRHSMAGRGQAGSLGLSSVTSALGSAYRGSASRG
mmetsp:Transcript_83896/g.224448  ORF Transcript_83896/g.224448 Transcript_83896/m.224448 type:complete len:108 (-) Transcript_83896:667-990(-)